MKKYEKIQLTKNKMNLNNRKMKNHPPPLPASCIKGLTSTYLPNRFN